ncbi:secA translation cis-regulator SecM [Candidatus Erwinia dacicola]|uniref:Secretion monitor n=1 Tax=Candidatus Erwinia dacicola TaxID=252393 RepID=A0A1E7YX96_9GAMM|nr:secA translation cis-regulator SecM [Candidatus Erwinia dacicola]NJD00603.1 secA regulator SecM [Candidatus Erwinia dacicola]NJD85540.1 secA regulator SecM [Candidatus Erwinia dacicola]OFC61130.1 SecA regulator SecM [Candidatus Erwinia dacicola]
MIDILNRWRQFGRRYLWPHLLLGMVAASLALLHASAHDRPTLAETSSRSLNIGTAVRFDSLALLESARRLSFSVDYWHQHAIRTVIRHLSFTLTPSDSPVAEETQPLEAHKLALLDTLNSLLTHEAKPPVIIRTKAQRQVNAVPRHQTGLWLAQVHGIRAGPLHLIHNNHSV